MSTHFAVIVSSRRPSLGSIPSAASFLLLYVVFLHNSAINAFNIDTKAPVVKLGSPDSYFGYSVAIHLLTNSDTGSSKPVVLVGAPRDNVTDSSAPPAVKKLVRPGAVYKCPFTSNLRDCTALNIDREDLRPEDDKDDQWLGVSVASQGVENGKALACAHRYRQKDFGKRVGIGQCYTMNNELQDEDLDQPCSGRRPMANDGTYAYAFCQAGASVDIGKDGDILLGAPGTYTWRGSMFKRFTSGSISEDYTWYQTPVEDLTDNNRGRPPPLKYYSHLGMSVKITSIIGQKWYIGGAPRSEIIGQVLMFRFINGQFHVEPEHILDGTQFGSGFGYDIAVADFNGDSKEDLVVSAPFYHARHTGGAIYVYYHGVNGITKLVKPQVIYSRKMKEVECVQLNCNDARFGLAMSTLGDIDRDGYQDLAVGAPYEGNGAVYIYRGSSHGLRPEASQRIAASDVSKTPLNSFGSSLNGGIDMDRNGYLDLVVGSFASNAVVILRARPVVNIITSVSSTPDRIDRKEKLCRVDKSSNVCFEIQVCFKYSAEPKERFNTRMDVLYQLNGDTLSELQLSRVSFSPGESAVVNGSLTMNPQFASAAKCNKHLAYLKKNTRDFMTPVMLLLSYKLRDEGNPTLRPGEPIDDINDYPVLNEAEARVNISVPFATNCGDDHLCKSNISIKPYFGLESDNRTDKHMLRIGKNTEMILVVPITNSGEDAHQTELTIALPETIEFIGTVGQGEEAQTCSPVDNILYCSVGNPLLGGKRAVVTIRLDAGKVLPSQEQLDFTIEVNTTSINVNPNGSKAILSVVVIYEIDMAVRGSTMPSQVFYSGLVKGESAIQNEEQIGSSIEYVYEVVNFGDITTPNAKLIIEWPYEWKKSATSDHGKHILYLLEKPRWNGANYWRGYCHFDPEWVNPLNIQLTESSGDKPNAIEATEEDEEQESKRKRRSIKRPLLDRGHRKSVTMNCADQRVKCHRMECTLGELVSRDSVSLSMRFRLWNHTFVEDFADVGEVRIFSKAEVKLDASSNVILTNRQNDILNLMITAIPEISVQESEGVPIWIILIAVIAGVILLSLFIVVLWRCGFFKRRRVTGEENREVHQATRTKAYNDDSYKD